MSWSFSADKPIFQQLVDIITLDIVSGRYAPGERIMTALLLYACCQVVC